MKKMREIEKLLFYHGSANKIDKFEEGIVFLAEDFFDAKNFGKGVHIPGQYGRASYVYTLSGKPGKMFDADEIVLDFVMELENDFIGDYVGDLDTFLEDILAPDLRKNGYRYFYFNHPSSHGDDIRVYVSLYPRKDLEIFDVEKI